VPPLHCYIYFPCSTCTTIIITLEPCALMLSFRISSWDLINFLTLRIPLKEGIGGKRRPKDRVTLQITLIITYLLSTYFLVMVVLLTHIHVIWICTKPAIHVMCLGFKVFSWNHHCTNCMKPLHEIIFAWIAGSETWVWTLIWDFLASFFYVVPADSLLVSGPYFLTWNPTLYPWAKPICFQMPYSCLHA